MNTYDALCTAGIVSASISITAVAAFQWDHVALIAAGVGIVFVAMALGKLADELEDADALD